MGLISHWNLLLVLPEYACNIPAVSYHHTYLSRRLICSICMVLQADLFGFPNPNSLGSIPWVYEMTTYTRYSAWHLATIFHYWGYQLWLIYLSSGRRDKGRIECPPPLVIFLCLPLKRLPSFYDYYKLMTTIGNSIAFQAEALTIMCNLCQQQGSIYLTMVVS